MNIIILAGGSGTRLWPISRQKMPKQFLSFSDNQSLLQKTVNRFLGVSFVENILVVTNQQYQELTQQQIPTIKILAEPESKNTAAAIILALKYLEEIDNHSRVLVLPSDHLIVPEDKFLDYLQRVESANNIITFGIRPSKPETGYGYIQTGKQIDDLLFDVEEFVEKPNLQTAEKYVLSGKYFWNSGMFLFDPKIFWGELKICFERLYQYFSKTYVEFLAAYPELPDISIDYALMEKTSRMVICPMDITWSDIGSWDSLYDVLEKDADANVKIGNILAIDTKNCFIMGDKRLISTIGLEDLLVIETQDALFIGKKGESQKVKNIIKKLLQQQDVCHLQ